MYKVLVIGCGGSGAKTLSYMMDQLRADLAVYGIEEIPGCWQFLNVDTPVQEETSAVGSVSRQGGAYVSCGVADGRYRTVDEVLTTRVQSRDAGGLRHLATWIPRRPKDVSFPVTVGAGQFRGIGRLLILRRLGDVREAVEAALARMASPQAREAAEQVARTVPGMGDAPSSSATPMVLVVSSMAGGSGASMTLDVCRLVAGATTTPAIDPQKISVFLYTAEVFEEVPDHLRAGMPGNTLAMLGEIMAAQTGAEGDAARLDADLYSLFGVSITAERAFKRVTPIGLRAGGTGAVFGDGSTDGVFRGMGRGLARYISSPAFDRYVSFDIANDVDVPNRSLVSWDVDPTDTAWSSFGYASLSMGRDRYAEYAAQRLARRTVDHALDGFRLPGGSSNDSQRLADLWEHRRSGELVQMGLPMSAGTTMMGATSAVDRETLDWLLSDQASKALNKTQLAARARSTVNAVMARRPQTEGMPVAEWGAAMANWLRTQENLVRPELEDASLQLAVQRAREHLDRIVDQTRRDLADLGIPYAIHVMGELGQSGGALRPLADRLEQVGAQCPSSALKIPDTLSSTMRGMGKTLLGEAGSEQLVDRLTTGLTDSVFQWLLARSATALAVALRDLAASAVKPLSDAMDDARKVLELERKDDHSAIGVADVATDLYQAWPGEPLAGEPDDLAVPKRFATAHNEVVLMGVEQYPGRFLEHIAGAVPQELGGDLHQAYAEAVREVLTGRWEQGSGDRAPEDLLRVSTRWVPAGLQGATGNALPTAARYELKLRAADVVGRARAFVGRRGEVFARFTSQSLREYLEDDAVGDFEKSQRSEEVLAGLKRVLDMARPLVEVDERIYSDLHDGERPRLSFTFSAIPFRGLDVAGQFLEYLKNNPSVAPGLLGEVERSLDDEEVPRVDVFGSYPRTLPVAYSGLLNSVSKTWDGAIGSDGARGAFWKWRRARPLPGGLPVGDEERRAMVRGWWAATLSGGVDRPEWKDRSAARPVRIWDRGEGEWVAFPYPLLTPRARMIAPNAWLASVLESMLLAYVQIERRGLEAFRPWKVLRRWADDGENDKEISIDDDGPVWTVLGELLGRGHVAGLPVPGSLEGLEDAEERRKKLLAQCDLILRDLDQKYLPGAGKADDAKHFTNYAKRVRVETTPLSVDLAQEMYDELVEVREILTRVEPSSGERSGDDADEIEY